jgi:hypothetical protein
MLGIELQERIVESKDWATLLFVLCLGIVTVNKSISWVRFSEFIRLAVSSKYNKIYRDSGNLLDGFTVSMFVLQLISFSFFILLVIQQFEAQEKEPLILYIQVFTLLSVFVLSKYLIEKIIATAFKIEEFTEHFNLLKVNYRTYLSLLLLPINIILFYNPIESSLFFWVLISLLFAINVITYVIAIKLYQNLLIRKIFYFILYLCSLEIAPYYFIYNWFTKN